MNSRTSGVDRAAPCAELGDHLVGLGPRHDRALARPVVVAADTARSQSIICPLMRRAYGSPRNPGGAVSGRAGQPASAAAIWSSRSRDERRCSPTCTRSAIATKVISGAVARR